MVLQAYLATLLFQLTKRHANIGTKNPGAEMKKIEKLEKRKMRRHSMSFASIEERDRFLEETFPKLTPTKKAGYFLTPNGGKLSVWHAKVIWSEPHDAS
jgi:hypothetical protein